MTVKEAWWRLRKDPRDGWYYIQGWARLLLWQHPFLYKLIRHHIAEQFVWRTEAAKACCDNHSCICCTCDVPAVFFASKACSMSNPAYRACLDPKFREKGMPFEKLGDQKEPCYPPLMTRKQWQNFKTSRASEKN